MVLVEVFILLCFIATVMRIRFNNILYKNKKDLRVISGIVYKVNTVWSKVVLCLLVYYCSSPLVILMAVTYMAFHALMYIAGYYIYITHSDLFLNYCGVTKYVIQKFSEEIAECDTNRESTE